MNPIFAANGGAVKRYHAVHTLTADTVAQHSFHVAWICAALWAATHAYERPSAALLLSALAHDLAEQEFGDIPAPTKRAISAFEKMAHLEDAYLAQNGYNFEDSLSAEECFVLRLADALDGVRFCTHERSLGNAKMLKVSRKYEAYLSAMTGERPEFARAVRQILDDIEETL